MNIAMFTDAYYPRVNGVAVSVKSYADELAKRNHNVIIVCCDYTQRKGLRKRIFKSYFYDKKSKNLPNVQVLRIPADHILFSKEDRAARIYQWHTIKKELDIFKPDVVHVNSEFLMGWFGVTYARHRHIAMVFTFHTLWEDYIYNYVHLLPVGTSKAIGRELVKFYLKRANEIICPTERIAAVAKEYGIDRPVDILPTGIPNEIVTIDKAKDAPFRKQLFKIFPALKNKRILLYVGRIVKEKNLDFLFDVFANVKKSVDDVALLFVGGGPELEPLKEKARKLPHSWNICFTGYRSRTELAYFYNLAEVFVFPSVTETQGLVTIEAMLSGTPVVAIGEMGTLDVMQGDNGGFMVSNNVDEFSSRVVELLSNSDLYNNKVQEALAWGQKWSMDCLTPKLIEYYEKGIDIKKTKRKASE